MLKARLLLIFGIWMVILPYLGFPRDFKNYLFSITGLIIIYFSYSYYKELKSQINTTIDNSNKKIFDNFSENNDFSENEKSEIESEIDISININEETKYD
jgi:hypothetical protein